MEAIDELIDAAQTFYDARARMRMGARARGSIAIACFEMRGPTPPRTATI